MRTLPNPYLKQERKNHLWVRVQPANSTDVHITGDEGHPHICLLRQILKPLDQLFPFLHDINLNQIKFIHRRFRLAWAILSTKNRNNLLHDLCYFILECNRSNFDAKFLLFHFPENKLQPEERGAVYLTLTCSAASQWSTMSSSKDACPNLSMQ